MTSSLNALNIALAADLNVRVPPRRRRDGRRGSDAAGAEQRGSLHGREEGRPRHFFQLLAPSRAADAVMLRLVQRSVGRLAGVAVGVAVAREDKAAKS